MEIKLDKANENIIELVDRLVNATVANHSGHCLKVVYLCRIRQLLSNAHYD